MHPLLQLQLLAHSLWILLPEVGVGLLSPKNYASMLMVPRWCATTADKALSGLASLKMRARKLPRPLLASAKAKKTQSASMWMPLRRF